MKVAVKVSSEAMIRALRLALLDSRQKATDTGKVPQGSQNKERDNVARS